MAKKHKNDTHHEYISIKQHQHGFLFRLSNYFVLLSMIGITHFTGFVFADTIYLLVFSAIVGYDVPAIINTLQSIVGKKK